MRKQTLIAILTTSAFVLTALPFLEGQFPAESTIPKSKRKGNNRVKKGPPGPTPRMADGKPDLSGVWGYAGYTSDLAKDYDVGELPMTPFAEKLFKERQANEGTEDPEARCLPTGVPRRDPYPSKIIHLPKLVVILFEGNLHSFRQIFLDRDHPKDLYPTWWGDSVAKWEGDELVVDTIGFNGKTWLDLAGHGTSEQLHVIERYSRPDYGNLKDEITIEDPEYYTRPWKVTQWTPLITDSDLWEYICTENEKDVVHLDNLIRAEKEAKAKANKK